MDIKNAFDVERQLHVATIMGDHDVHGRIIAAFLLVMAGFLKDMQAPSFG